MKLPVKTSQAKKCRTWALAGAILAEAAIGLALLVCVWILFVYISYMSDNRIRCNMSARYSAWLSGNGVSAIQSTAQYAFMRNDTNIVSVKSTKNTMSVLGISLPSIIVPDPYIYSNSVTFGTNYTDISASSPFPFNLLKARAPFMPDEMLTNFTIVTAHCAWPDVSDTYNSYLPPSIIPLAAMELYWEGGIATAN